ncbi:hypothetical protein DPMN_033008, partial [Dreissena polymorpha]
SCLGRILTIKLNPDQFNVNISSDKMSLAGDRLYVINAHHKLCTLATDGRQVLVCGLDSHTVIQVDHEGRKELVTLASQKDGLIKPVPEFKEVREIGNDIDYRHSTFEYRAGSNVEPVLTSTFGNSPEYRVGENVQPALTLTFGTSPEYRAGANVEPALTSTIGTSPEYRAGANVEPALISTFDNSLEYRAGANIERALTSTFGKSPEHQAGTNVEPAMTSILSKSPEY